MNKLNADLTPKINKLKMTTTRRPPSFSLSGETKSGFKGEGTEFTDFREYQPSDDATQIDWKATLRANKVLVKEFSEEKRLTIFFLIDISASMLFGSTEKLKNEYTIELVNSLAHGIVNVGDNVGFILFNDKIVKKLPPTNEKGKIHNLMEYMLDPKIYKGSFDLGNTLKYANSFIPKNCIVIIISDFLGLKGEWKKQFELAGRKFDLAAILLRDPRDKKLENTAQQFVISDPFSGKKLLLDPNKIKDEYNEYVKQNERNLKKIFEKRKCQFIDLTTDQSYVGPVIKFTKRRSKL